MCLNRRATYGMAKTLSSKKLLVRALLRSHAERCVGAARASLAGSFLLKVDLPASKPK